MMCQKRHDLPELTPLPKCLNTDNAGSLLILSRGGCALKLRTAIILGHVNVENSIVSCVGEISWPRLAGTDRTSATRILKADVILYKSIVILIILSLLTTRKQLI